MDGYPLGLGLVVIKRQSYYIFFYVLRNSTKIEVNQVNLAYLTALFPESEIVREQLTERRTRLKSCAAAATTSSLNDSILVGGAGDDETRPQYHSLLSVQVIPTQKLQILFLLMLVRA